MKQGTLLHAGKGLAALCNPASTVPPRFLSFISVFSQVQLRELSYTCV